MLFTPKSQSAPDMPSRFLKGERARMSARLASLTLLFAVLYLAGNNRVALFDRDEPWYAEISREMVRTGDWVVPRFDGVVFVGKPVFLFWCSASSICLFGDTPFAVRLPSALAVIGALLLTATVIARWVGHRRALWTMLILGTNVLTIALAKMCLTDAILLFWITLAQIALFAIYQGRGGWRAVLLLWGAIGFAVMSKGPVVVGVQGGTAIALLLFDVGSAWRSREAWHDAMRWWPRTKPWFGIGMATAIVLPWAILIQRREPGFLTKTWLDSMVGPIAKASLEGHAAPPGYFLAMIWPMFLPWSLLLPLALAKGWTNRHLPSIRFALAALLGPWVVIELVKQKLPHYLLPMFPALAFLTADALVRCIRGQYRDLHSPRSRVGLLGWAVAVAAAGFIPLIGAFRPLNSAGMPWVALSVLALGTITYAVAVVTLLASNRAGAAAAVIGGGMFFLAIVLYVFVLPQLQFMRLSDRCANELRARGATAPGSSVATLIMKHEGGRELGYKEPSLTYCLDGHLRICDADLLSSPSSRWPAWLVITDAIWEQVPTAARPHLERVATLRGLNYGGGGKMIDLAIVKNLGTVGSRRELAVSTTVTEQHTR
jgi:4-amino-4-deoxy-L-arabinose transferase-like glycosyltransferase